MSFQRAFAFLVTVGEVSGNGPFFAKDAPTHFEETYLPAWTKLFLHEGQSMYPLPSRDKVKDLLKPLNGTKGMVVHTEPGITVTEGHGYAMLAAGMQKDIDALKSLTVGWQASGQGLGDTPACGGCGVAQGGLQFSPSEICTGKRKSPCICKTIPGAYMPGWNLPLDDLGKMGSATDGDEDAVAGLIYLAELTDSDEFREYAVRSITAFVLEDIGYANASLNSREVPVKGDIPKPLQKMYLWRGGTCWGGYDTSSTDHPADRNLCINPAYFSPGEWRLFKQYLIDHAEFVPKPYKAKELAAVLDSAIVWGYNTLQRIACPNGLVSNWWTVPNKGWPYHGELKCQNSGTVAGAHYSDAARIPWRVVLDYLWFGDAARAPIYDEHGKRLGTWGAKEYANRWAGAWIKLITDSFDKGFPPLEEGTTPLRPDQVIPLLSNLQKCKTCPLGFTAVPWNGWGSYPVVTAFQVPLDGMDAETNQEWLDFLADITFQGCTHKRYFDLGQEVVVSAMLSGKAWLPLPKASKPKSDKVKPITKAQKSEEKPEEKPEVIPKEVEDVINFDDTPKAKDSNKPDKDLKPKEPEEEIEPEEEEPSQTEKAESNHHLKMSEDFEIIKDHADAKETNQNWPNRPMAANALAIAAAFTAVMLSFVVVRNINRRWPTRLAASSYSQLLSFWPQNNDAARELPVA